MIYFNKYSTQNGDVLALCDEEHIGKVLEEGKTVLDLDKYAGFYKGELLDHKTAISRVKESNIYTANAVGKNSIEVFKSLGIVTDEEIKTIKGVPFIQIYKLLV